MTSLKKGKLVNDNDSVCDPLKPPVWHLCIICKLGSPKDEGVKCLDIMGHAGKYWMTDDPMEALK